MHRSGKHRPNAITIDTAMIHTFLLLLAMLAPPPAMQNNASVSVTATQLQSAKGKVYFYLYDSEKGFPTKPDLAKRSASAGIVGSEAKAVFDNVPAGTYAVSVYHDEDGDGELDTNFLGIPSEGVGVSRNAKGSFGPPSFADASFAVQSSPVQMKIRIKY